MGVNKKVPMRKCVGCQEIKSKKEMIRVIRTSEGEFLLDATGRKNGRGAYLCPNGGCLAKAVKNKGLERSFKQAIPKEVYEALEKEMEVLESELSIIYDWSGYISRQGCKWRVLYGERSKIRKSMSCDRCRRCIR